MLNKVYKNERINMKFTQTIKVTKQIVWHQETFGSDILNVDCDVRFSICFKTFQAPLLTRRSYNTLIFKKFDE